MRAWVERLRGSDTDATFLIRRAAATTGTTLLGDRLYDELALTLRLTPSVGSPNRTLSRFDRMPVTVQQRALRRGRPNLRIAVLEPPLWIRRVGPADARHLIDLAREAMVTRGRDLYPFAAAESRDVLLADCGDGLAFALVGVALEQRLLLEGVYGFLTLKNGVPIGYGLVSALWRSSEIAFNVFESFRGAEAGWVYGRLLALMHALLGVDTFTMYPYQLGHENDEGLESGAWWFYYKMGFRPKDPVTLALATREGERAQRRPDYRTPRATLEKLVRANLFFHASAPRQDVIGVVPVNRIALAVTDLMADRFGADREGATTALSDEAARRLGAGAWIRLPPGPRFFWQRWAPWLALLPGVEAWTDAERHAVVDIVRAKGGRSEIDFVRRFDAHPKLGAAIVSMSLEPCPPSHDAPPRLARTPERGGRIRPEGR
jgi:hypothetical protein